MAHNVGRIEDGVSHYVVCDVCGRGPSNRVWIRPRYVPGKPRTDKQRLAWARQAGRRIGLEIGREIELKKRGFMTSGADLEPTVETNPKAPGP